MSTLVRMVDFYRNAAFIDETRVHLTGNSMGGHAALILFPELGHNCRERVYSDEQNDHWLLSFTNERDKASGENLSGNYYG